MSSGDGTMAAARGREQLAAILSHATEVLVRGTTEGTVSWVSATVTAQLGWRPDELAGRPIEDLVHPEDQGILHTIQAGLNAGRPQQAELRMRRTDGTYARTAVAMRPVMDDDGTVTGRTGGWRMIDERPWGADTLDDRALRFVAEHTAEVLLVVSPDQFLLWSTAAVRDLLGWEPAALSDRDLAEFIHPDDRSAVMPHLDAVTRPQDPVAPPRDLIVRVLAASGGHVWVSMRLVPLVGPDGELIGIVVSLRKIDDLFSSRQELAAERARLRATVDSVLDPHVTLQPLRDAQGTIVDLVITDANPAACESQGRHLGDLLGTGMAELAPLAWPSGLFDVLVDAVDGGGPVNLESFLYARDSDGAERRYDVRAVESGGQLICSWRDVGMRATPVEDELDELARRAARLLDRDGLTEEQRVDLLRIATHARDARGEALR